MWLAERLRPLHLELIATALAALGAAALAGPAAAGPGQVAAQGVQPGGGQVAPQAGAQGVQPGGGQATQQAGAQQAGAAAAAGANQGGLIDRILLRVNGDAVLHSEFEARFAASLATFAGQIPADELEAQLPDLRMSVLVGMVQSAALQQHAEDLGITANANDIDRAIARVRENQGLLDDELWRQALAENGMTEAEFRTELSRSIVMQRVMTEITRNVLVSEREAVAYYEQNIDEFTSPEQVLFGQIILVFRGADRAPIRERAEQALAELRAGGSLSAVGAKYAIPPNDQVLAPEAASWLSPNDLQPHVAATLAEMTPMSSPEIVEGPFGYYILQLLDRRESTTRPYEEAAQEVKARLQDRKTSERLDGFLKELLRDAYIEVYAEEFEQLPAILQVENNGAPTGPSR